MTNTKEDSMTTTLIRTAAVLGAATVLWSTTPADAQYYYPQPRGQYYYEQPYGETPLGAVRRQVQRRYVDQYRYQQPNQYYYPQRQPNYYGRPAAPYGYPGWNGYQRPHSAPNYGTSSGGDR
jgi:hypothetical protein